MSDRGVARTEFKGSSRAGYASVSIGDILEILHRGESAEDSGWLYVKRACTQTNASESGWVPAAVLTDLSSTGGSDTSLAEAQVTVCTCVAAFNAPNDCGYLRARLGDQVDVLHVDGPWLFVQRTMPPFDEGWLPVEIIKRSSVPTPLQTKDKDVTTSMRCSLCPGPKTAGEVDGSITFLEKDEVVEIPKDQMPHTFPPSFGSTSFGSASPWQSGEKGQSTGDGQSDGKTQLREKAAFTWKAGFFGSAGALPKSGATQPLPQVALDAVGCHYDLRTVVVNFANVGATYAEKVLKKSRKQCDRMFDWEGVRKCVQYLSGDLEMQVVGVVFEKFRGPDNGSHEWCTIPKDIRDMCASVQTTPQLTGKNHMSADDEMTIKCAYNRNCRLLDNDNYRDWLAVMRNDRVKMWLNNVQEFLQMRYYFDSDLGTFDTLDGNIPLDLLGACTC